MCKNYLDMFIFFIFIPLCLSSNEASLKGVNMEFEAKPAPIYLYKILSLQLWEASENGQVIQLPKEDDAFIHFSTEEQLDKIVDKYWSGVHRFVILKIRTDRLKGELISEVNPGGTTEYYHLYKGSIPLDSVVESKIINQF